jgi:predicted TPR repeat methyltransferase
MSKEAEASCRSCLGANPSHFGALRLLAAIASASGRSGEAAELLAQAVRVAPGNAAAQAQVDLGHTLLALRRSEEAVTAFTGALAIDPAHLHAQTSLGVALSSLGRVAAGEAAFRKALELDGRHAIAYSSLGELLRRSGRLLEARECFESALRLTSRELPARLALADVLVELGEFESAAERYREAIALSPRPSLIYAKLGVALRELGDQAASLEAMRTAVKLDPTSAAVHLYNALTLLASGRIHEAIASAEGAVRLAGYPAAYLLHGSALAMLGDLDGAIAQLRIGLGQGKSASECLAVMATLLLRMGHADSALQCFNRVLEIEPDNVIIRHQVAALSGTNPERASDEYVSRLFDAVAQSFDHHLLHRLSYAAPQAIRDAILSARPHLGHLDILDLGCGTGLVGVELRPYAHCLVGVDLSEEMLQRARDRNIYTRLECKDLLSSLAGEHDCRYDAVTAADVFIYVGRLDLVVQEVHRVLRPAGLFAFTTEAAATHQTGDDMPAAGYRLTKSGRYAHEADYLKALALRGGFRINSLRKVQLRLEERRPVVGWLALWSRAA